jgi:hypothetical protein
MFSAWRGQDFRRDSYEPLVTVTHAPSSLPISVPVMLYIYNERICLVRFKILYILSKNSLNLLFLLDAFCCVSNHSGDKQYGDTFELEPVQFVQVVIILSSQHSK